MIFSSFTFLFVFFPIVFLVGWTLKKISTNLCNYWLLFASFIFYAWSGLGYFFVFLFSICLDWFTGNRIQMSIDIGKQKRWLLFGVMANVVVLFFFKYMNFITHNIALLLPTQLVTNITLPLGISFYTFQGISFMVDSYREKSGKRNRFSEVALYISLFPQLVAGPIVRYDDIKIELATRTIDESDKFDGLFRFIKGLFKKVVIADTMGIIADNVFAMNEMGSVIAWLGAIAYSFQIFYDFSGYSDMAIGMGRMLGFHFHENFNYPYIATSVTDFWRRWHISLSTWFRDYVYIPLGGNRVSKKRHITNILCVWFLTGLWHGANWTFILWGIYYAGFLLIEKYLFQRININKVPNFLKHIITMIIVIVGWVIFRSESLGKIWNYLLSMFGMVSIGSWDYQIKYVARTITNYWVYWGLAIVFIFPLTGIFREKVQELRIIKVNLLKYICIILLLGIDVLFLISSSHNAFIYFNF